MTPTADAWGGGWGAPGWEPGEKRVKSNLGKTFPLRAGRGIYGARAL